MRMSVGNPLRVQRKRQTSVLYWPNANQFPTRLAIYRQLGLRVFFLESYSNSAALICQKTPVDTKRAHI